MMKQIKKNEFEAKNLKSSTTYFVISLIAFTQG